MFSPRPFFSEAQYFCPEHGFLEFGALVLSGPPVKSTIYCKFGERQSSKKNVFGRSLEESKKQHNGTPLPARGLPKSRPTASSCVTSTVSSLLTFMKASPAGSALT
jgi:hypothetical protein